MEIAQVVEDYIDSLSDTSAHSLDGIATKLLELDVISQEDHGKFTNATDSEKLELLVSTLITKGTHFTSLVRKITDLQGKWNSGQNRQLATTSGARGERRILPSSADVSEDWTLKVFLMKISQSIDTEEFELMKDLIGGELGFKTATLEKLTTPMKMFKHMLTTRKISIYNTIYLQSVLWHLQRKDLMQEFISFSVESQKRVVYFYTPRDTPENGYKYLKFYIGGDITRLTVKELEQLRVQVSTTLCVPLKFVYLDGIEPSNSILLTFMVPDNSIEIFISFAGHNQDCMEEFGLFVEIRHDVLILRENCSKEDQKTSTQTSMEEHLKELLHKEQKLKEELNDQAEQLLDLQEIESDREVSNAVVKRNQETLVQEVEMYRRMFHKALDVVDHLNITGEVVKNGHRVTTASRLEIQSCLTLHTSLLARAKETRMDLMLLSEILDVNSTLSAMQEKQKFVDTLKEFRSIIQTLEGRTNRFQFENYFITASTLITGMPVNALQAFLIKQEQTRLQTNQTVQLNVNVPVLQATNIAPVNYPFMTAVPSLHPWHTQILKAMTEDLNQRDCNRLRKILKLNETEKQILDSQSFRLLEIALMRELQAGKENQPLENILGSILGKIQRKDLLVKYFPKPSQEDAIKKPSKEKRSTSESRMVAK
ncbi:uncharacterized protein LOC121369630 [Gigantopelta aegis]|uniref:uncharacterized protein LOC121369630 n=1 Tax=Gigantopelta aegis TaxID=1735272 RepID=UPI001B88D117|nr:uncharacterized protein LOC121369630 [Gigantopelta aegis]XP_041350595.1 uncharacterized protein LOC121369630 [Gigantopelta aegis]